MHTVTDGPRYACSRVTPPQFQANMQHNDILRHLDTDYGSERSIAEIIVASTCCELVRDLEAHASRHPFLQHVLQYDASHEIDLILSGVQPSAAAPESGSQCVSRSLSLTCSQMWAHFHDCHQKNSRAEHNLRDGPKCAPQYNHHSND